MSDTNTPETTASDPVVPPETPEERHAESPQAQSAQQTSQQAGPAPLGLEEQVRQAEARAHEMQDRYLRLNAEFENFKKRMAKENADKFKYYHTGLIKELLPAIDSLEQAIQHAKKENTNLASIAEGVEMVHKLVQGALEKFGVTKVTAAGVLFDPNCHQAVGTVESETVPENHVVDVFQAGYFLYDRIVRPAMVRVSKKQ